MAEWVLLNKNQPKSDDLARAIYQNRNLPDEEFESFIAPDYDKNLPDPYLLADMAPAVERIMLALENKERVVIYGDYDIDGITAATVLHNTLSMIGLTPQIYIPDRFDEGYGLNTESLQSIAQTGVDLVISVDCGITATDQVAAATKMGLDIIVTDHHNIEGDIPAAAIAAINPKRTDCKYPTKDLAGVGVAFALTRAIQKKLPNLIKPGQEKWLLDLVALGTICDVVPLTGENRVLASFGLKVLSRTRNIGLRALMDVSAVDPATITSQDLGFRLGPRLNAAGRIEHASLAIKLLNSTDQTDAIVLAEKLNHLNTNRRDLTEKIVREAELQAKTMSADKILVLASQSWSHGVVGIVASRISECFGKPTIVMQIDGEIAKGSARSVGDFSIINALHSAKSKLIKYGGHDFAAGLTVSTSNIDWMRQKLNNFANQFDFDYTKQYLIDLSISAKLINLDSYNDIERLAPFGRDNGEPNLVSELTLKSIRPIGKELNHLKFTFATDEAIKSGIAFGRGEKWPWLENAIGQKVEVAYRLIKNEWKGRVEVELEVIDLRTLK